MLYHTDVVETDGNKTLTDSMKEFAEKNYDDMTWKSYRVEEEAKERYKSYKGKKAKMLCKKAEVLEKGGDEKSTASMKEYAEENWIHTTERYHEKVKNKTES